jgi:hypothetical protein
MLERLSNEQCVNAAEMSDERMEGKKNKNSKERTAPMHDGKIREEGKGSPILCPLLSLSFSWSRARFKHFLTFFVSAKKERL